MNFEIGVSVFYLQLNTFTERQVGQTGFNFVHKL